MKLIQIYRCLCDETRLRILHLLTRGPLCVCHFQDILKLPQVAVSKHLAYLRANGLVVAQRLGNWMIYRLPEKAPSELHLQLRCLQDCVQSHPIFRQDLKELKKLKCECEWVEQAVQPVKKKKGLPFNERKKTSRVLRKNFPQTGSFRPQPAGRRKGI